VLAERRGEFAECASQLFVAGFVLAPRVLCRDLADKFAQTGVLQKKLLSELTKLHGGLLSTEVGPS
jgi:hypothetical protein